MENLYKMNAVKYYVVTRVYGKIVYSFLWLGNLNRIVYAMFLSDVMFVRILGMKVRFRQNLP